MKRPIEESVIDKMAAYSGETDDERAIRHFIESVNAGKTPERELLEWVALSLDKILDRKKINEVFDLKSKKGRPKNFEKKLDVACSVARYMAKGMTISEAKEKTRQDFHFGNVRDVQRYYKECKEVAAMIVEKQLKHEEIFSHFRCDRVMSDSIETQNDKK